MDTRELLDRLIAMGVDVPVLAVEERHNRFIVTLQGGVILTVEKELEEEESGAGLPEAGTPAAGTPTAGTPAAGTPARAQPAEKRPPAKKKPSPRAVVTPSPDHPWKKRRFKPETEEKKK